MQKRGSQNKPGLRTEQNLQTRFSTRYAQCKFEKHNLPKKTVNLLSADKASAKDISAKTIEKRAEKHLMVFVNIWYESELFMDIDQDTYEFKIGSSSSDTRLTGKCEFYYFSQPV